MVSLFERTPLGAWVCQGRTGLIANHVPFLLDRSRGPLGTLVAHVARANPVWRVLDAAAPSVVEPAPAGAPGARGCDQRRRPFGGPGAGPVAAANVVCSISA